MNRIKTQLRDYQQEAAYKVRKAVASGHKRVVCQSPTGSGKTKLACDFVAGALQKGNPAVFLVPYITLIDQTCESFEAEGLEPLKDISVIQSDHPWYDPGAPLQICSVATLARRKIYPEASIVIVDEAHRNSRFVWDWMERNPETVFIGLTATPWTKGMGKHWDELVVITTTAELIDRGYLSPFRVFAPSAPDLEGIKTVAGEYHQGELGERTDKATLIASIVETWLEKAEGRPTLCYAVNRAHAAHIQEQFLAAGVKAGYVDAYTDRDERRILRRAFESGKIQVICNVGVLVAGVDWDVRCIILATPTKSEIKFVQAMGRGLRTAKGKDYLLCLDHSDTHNRLGFVTDIHHDTLDMGTEKKASEKKEKLPKPCPSCAALIPPKTKICPFCGFEKTPQPGVHEEDGELEEITEGMFQKTKKTYSAAEKERIWAQLKYIALERGYSKGWIWHTIQDMVGSAPRNQDVKPEPPGEQVRNYVLHKMIKYQKSGKRKSSGSYSGTQPSAS